MSSDNTYFSDDSIDTFILDFHTGKHIKNEGILRKDWEAVEQQLYSDDGPHFNLNSKLIHECRLWRETFPHLRVRGLHIDNPYRVKREKIKHQIISHVVDDIIDRINGGVLNIGKDKCVQQKHTKTHESYYERGKAMEVDLGNTAENRDNLQSEFIFNTSTSVSPNEENSTKPIPRSILKNSSSRKSRQVKALGRRRSKDSTTFLKSSLPHISPTRNNWLIRAEQHNDPPPPSRRSSRNYPKPPKYHQDRRRKELLFPLISTPNGTKI